MQFTIHMGDPAERTALLRMLETWRGLTCASVEFADWTPEHRPEPGGILFWDLDDCPPPAAAVGKCALFLCSSSSGAAIASYPLHPAGLLRKPVGMDKLWAALHRSVKLWWDSLERLEITSDRCRIRLPLCDLVWVESTRRNSLVHSTQGPIATREALTALEGRLPRGLFLRCQRSFLVNLRHVRRLDSEGLCMSDGAVVPLSRSSRSEVAEAYRQFCLLWDGGKRDGETRYG